MQFVFTEEQQEFRAVLRRYFEETSPPSRVREAMATETGWDRARWRDLNHKLGLAGVAIPETYGGQGFGPVELGIVMEEMGRALVCAPFFASAVLAAGAILNAGTEAQKETLLPPVALGDVVATLAFTESTGRWDIAATETTATSVDGLYRLAGTKSFVLDGHAADLLVVLARSPGSAGDKGLSFFTLRGDAPGVTRQPLTALDPTRKIARITFDGAEADLLGELGGAAEPFRETMTLAAVALANEMMGGAEALRESALAYATLRVQFGRPIASFQTMKHKQADMLLEVELAKSAAYAAASAAEDKAEDAAALASLAKAAASEAYLQTAIHTIQIHGGIGFTWDNDTHLWFKRAKSSEVFLGDAAYHREAMLQAWGH